MADDILKAIEVTKKKKLIVPDPKGTIIDTTNVLNYLGTQTKPSQIGYAVLRAMALRCKPVSAIIQTRLNQIAKFTRRPEFKTDTGFKIALKEENKTPTQVEQARIQEIEEAILRTGFIPNKKRKDNFNMFLRRIIRDSLTLDALTFELVYNRKGEVCEWWAIDGATVELVLDQTPSYVEIPTYQPVTPKGMMDAGDIVYVQRLNSIVTAEWTEDELAYAIRNPRTDVLFSLFGLSELEVLVETVTAILNAEHYNSTYFTESNLPQGVLEIVGKYEPEHLEAFKRAWESLINGVVGKWKVPVMALEEGQGLKFTPFKQSSKDMEYHQWLDFLTTVACSVYQIDPAEIGFRAWSGGREGMFNSENTSSRLENSKDKGFFPLMTFLSDTINSELLNHIDPNFEFRWVGLNEENQDMMENQRNARLTTGFTTVNEERIAEDMPTIQEMLIEHGYSEDEAHDMGKWADAPANATLMQVYQTGMQAQLQQEQMQQQQQDQGMNFARQQYASSQEREATEQTSKEQYRQQLEQDNYNFARQQQLADKTSEQNRTAQLEQQAFGYAHSQNNPNTPNNKKEDKEEEEEKRLNKSFSSNEYLTIELELEE